MPIILADPTHGEDLASRSIATGTPTDFEENFSAAWQASRLNDRFIGEGLAIEEEYDSYIDQVFRSSGQRLPNPLRGELPPGMDKMMVTGDPRIPVPVEIAIQHFEDYARKIGASPPGRADLTKRAHARMFDLEQTKGDVASRASGTAAAFGSFLGSAGAVMTDPPLMMSMMFGGGQTASFLGLVGREALLAGGTEALLQAQVQSARVRAGLEGGVVLGLENVALAAGGSAVLAGAFRGAASTYRALRGSAREFQPLTAAEEGTARYVERYADLQSRNPLAETAEGVAEHVERVSAAQRRLYDAAEDAPETRLRDDAHNPVRRNLSRERAAIDLPTDLPAVAMARTLGERLAAEARVSVESLDIFRRARATALELGDLGDEQIDTLRRAAPRAPRDDPSLVQFVINRGGINDDDRSLSSINVTSRSRPGLIRKTGLTASQMSEAAAEAGYFPPALPGEGSRSVDQRELATAIQEELTGGQRLFARHGGEGNAEARAEFEAVRDLRDDLARAFEDLGLDTKKLSNAEIRVALRSLADTPDPMPAQRADHAAEAIDRVDRTEAEIDVQLDMEERLAIIAENDLRERFANRMDEAVYVEIDGEIHAVPARNVFKALEDDNVLIREFTNCVNRVPF